MSRPSTQSSLNQRAAGPAGRTSESSSVASCKVEEEVPAVIPQHYSADHRRYSQVQLRPVDPDGWPAQHVQPVLEQLTGHDLMALFPTQAPPQAVCCDDLFRSQAREFLSRPGWTVVGEGRVQEPFVIIEEPASGDPSRSLPTADDSRVYVPRTRRMPKNENYIPPLTRRPLPLHRGH